MEVLKVHPDDDMMVAMAAQPAGRVVRDEGIALTLPQAVAPKQKFVVRSAEAGERLRMYGATVGVAGRALRSGELLTSENLTHAADPVTLRSASPAWRPPDVSRWAGATFEGYPRPDGRVGLANEWVFIPLVFCENHNLLSIRDALLDELGYRGRSAAHQQTRRLVDAYRAGADVREISLDPPVEADTAERVFPNVDGIRFLTHTGGCGGTREDAANLCRLLAGYIDHPNVAGATILSLGCQHAQIEHIEAELDKRSTRDKPVLIFDQQRTGRGSTLIAEAIRQTFAGLIEADRHRRTPAPLDRLTIGVKCGGSDGFSGITANPAIGEAADRLVAMGGSVLLGEFPELFGAEQFLIDRCEDPDAAHRFWAFMKEDHERAVAVGSGFDQNPSPGNIADGLITDAMKSAGAVRKGGTSPVTDVLDYGERVRRRGLSLLRSPGNDVESTTAMAGSGAHLILFSTGLGTPTGNPVARTLKIATNTGLTHRMPDIIDLDAGAIARGEATPGDVGERLLELIVETASGRYTPCSVRQGQDDFIPWKRGVSL